MHLSFQMSLEDIAFLSLLNWSQPENSTFEFLLSFVYSFVEIRERSRFDRNQLSQSRMRRGSAQQRFHCNQTGSRRKRGFSLMLIRSYGRVAASLPPCTEKSRGTAIRSTLETSSQLFAPWPRIHLLRGLKIASKHAPTAYFIFRYENLGLLRTLHENASLSFHIAFLV